MYLPVCRAGRSRCSTPSPVDGGYGIISPMIFCPKKDLYSPNLLRNQLRRPSSIFPPSQEELSEERIQRLLLATQLLVPTAVLLPQGTEKPLEHEQGALGWVGLGRRRNEQRWVFGPVGGVFDQ